MSAFIVENACLENIVGYLSRLQHGSMEVYTRRPLEEMGYNFDDSDSLLKLAKDMMRLNCAGVNSRYGSSEIDLYVKNVKFKADRFGFPSSRCVPAQAYKSLSCFLYQCSEGDVPEQPLFKALEQVKIAIADDIVRSLPEWDKLVWG